MMTGFGLIGVRGRLGRGNLFAKFCSFIGLLRFVGSKATIGVGSLSVGLQQVWAGARGLQHSADYPGVAWSLPLPCQPGCQGSDGAAVFLIEIILGRFWSALYGLYGARFWTRARFGDGFGLGDN